MRLVGPDTLLLSESDRMTNMPENGMLKSGTDQRLLRLPEVMCRVGLKRSTIYKRMSEGRFPKSRSLGVKCAVWVESEISAWIKGIEDQ
jgi:prophage regulatory protein